MLRQTGCFAKERRLIQPADYQRIFRSSFRSTDAILLVIASRNDLGYARLGLAISRKWIRSAVERNQVKRLVRESFRKHQNSLCGLDIVVTTNKTPARLKNRDINNSLLKHWHRLITCKSS